MTRPPSLVPDALLLASGLALLLAGAFLLAQDLAFIADAQASESVLGERVVPGAGADRDAARQLLLAPLTVGALAGLWRYATLRRDERLRRWTRRPVRLLLLGGFLADVTWWLDANVPMDARGHRMLDPFYCVAGFLVLGAAWRILTLVRPLPPGDPAAYGL